MTLNTAWLEGEVQISHPQRPSPLRRLNLGYGRWWTTECRCCDDDHPKVGDFEVDVDGDIRTSGSLTTNGLTNNGDLTVNGNVTTLNTATLVVEDKNIVLANGSVNAAAADGAAVADGAADWEQSLALQMHIVQAEYDCLILFFAFPFNILKCKSKTLLI